jgi:DNA modification methylase
MKNNVCYQGDCLEVMKTLPENSIDSIVTDPPYELGFMGKKWDNSGIAYSVPMWKECLRVLKPGGHLLSFSGTRTYHRMAVAIEDAGFEVRDMIEWVYGSGFPKSLNIGKAVDKLQGNKREVVGNSRAGSKDRNGYKGDMAIMPFETETIDLDITKGTSEWEGWGTALKPAHEPICLARKPLQEKTVAENVLKYGTGGINIDESRVEYQGKEDFENTLKSNTGNIAGGTFKCSSKSMAKEEVITQLGRFPANLIHDNSEEVRECFPESSVTGKRSQKSINNCIESRKEKVGNSQCDVGGNIKKITEYTDKGSSARFFKSILYYPKASKSERNKGCEGLEEKEQPHSTNMKCANCGLPVLSGTGQSCKCENKVEIRNKAKNNHPTVKPIALMEYLIKMITPKGGVVLDPFAGSGSTLVAAKENDFNFIGIELTEEYIPIIEARTGCEIIKPSFYSTTGIDQAIKEQEENNIENNKKIENRLLDKCPKCNGRLKKTKYGMTCEDCLEDF